MARGAKGGAHMQINEIQTYQNSVGTRTQHADDGIRLFQMITPPFLSLQLNLDQSGQIGVLVNMENSRIIDHSSIVVVVCSLPSPSILANVKLRK